MNEYRLKFTKDVKLLILTSILLFAVTAITIFALLSYQASTTWTILALVFACFTYIIGSIFVHLLQKINQKGIWFDD